MNRSEIFESFIKIAHDNGLISEAEKAEHTEKDFHETNPRHDSLSIEQINKLYGVKTPKPKDMEYEKNIMEDAHPESVVLSPSHDKLNGLLENDIERQNILLHIVNKQPDGHLTKRKYARKQLLLSLVKIGNELDNKNQDELRKLADVCLSQLAEKKITKFANPALIIAGIAAALGALYIQQHMSFHSDGFTADYQKAINEIDDLLTSNSNWGVGYSYKPEFIQDMTKLKSDLSQINNAVQKVSPIVQNVDRPRTQTQLTQELARIAQDPKTQEADQAINTLKQIIDEYAPEIFRVISNFSKQSYKDMVISDKGALTKMVDWSEVLHGGAGLISDDFDDVKRALLTLWNDVKSLYLALNKASNIKRSLEAELQSGQSQVSEVGNNTTTVKSPTTTTDKESPFKNLEKEFSGLAGLSGE